MEEAGRRDPHCLEAVREHQQVLADSHGRPPETVIASERHALTTNVFEQVAVVKPAAKPDWRKRLDRVATHRVRGYVLLVLILGLFFQGVFNVGQYLEDYLTSYLDVAEALGHAWLGSQTLAYSVADGLLMGIFGGVAIVLPYLVPFLIGLAVMEDSGYLPRVAFLMDNLMHHLGLHGKSIIPFILGYGWQCALGNVHPHFGEPPGPVGGGHAGHPHPVFGPFRDYLRPGGLRPGAVLGHGGLSFQSGGHRRIGAAVHHYFAGGLPGAAHRNPQYRMPTWVNVAHKCWHRLKEFIVVAWPILILGSLALSLLKYFGLEPYVNKACLPFTALLGLPAAVGVTLIFGIMRKELSLIMLTEALGTPHITQALTKAQLLTFTIFVLFYIPCAATIAALSREIGWKGAAVAVVSTLVLATGLALLARAFAMLVF